MSRRKISFFRKIIVDQRFKSLLLSKFINKIMLNGKKSIAKMIVYSALKLSSIFLNKTCIEVFELSIKNVRPVVEVKTRRVGGSIYQVPVEVNFNRCNILAISWIIESARKRSDKSMILRLSNEFNDAFNNKGNAVKKRDEVHRMADSNKAFTHFRW